MFHRAAIQRIVLASSSVIVLAFIPGCLVESQKATDTFLSGQMPRSLEKIANQFHELANVVGLTDRVEKESTDTSLLPVAIIDCGMDLAHPDLVQKIAFDIENGRLTGAGYDFMGNDRWASANLVNPTLYAVAAEETADGKLTNVSDDPLGYLAKLNSDFMKDLQARIAADPHLSKSLFKNIGPQSMTLIGAVNYVEQRFYSDVGYKSALRDDSLIDVDTFERMAKDPDYAKRMNRQSTAVIAGYAALPWTLDAESGVPRAGYFDSTVNELTIGDLKYSDTFHEIVTQAVTDFDQKTGILKKLKTFKKFAALAAGPMTPMEGEELNELSHALYLKLNGLKSLDPISSLAVTLKLAALNEPANQSKIMARNFILDSKAYNAELENEFSRYEEMVQYLNNSGSKSPKLLNQLASIKASMGPMRELISWYRQDRKLDSTFGADPQAGSPQESLYRRYLARNANPYLSKDSNSAAHGTHTAGIVAAQDASIRIVPVRVTTQSMAANASEIEKTKAQFKKDFTGWLKTPLVFRAVGNEIKDLDGSNFSDFSEANRTKVSNNIAEAFAQKIDLEFEQAPLEFQFLNEVTSAIQYVGQRKIKIANISLGTSFSAVPASLSNLSQQEKLTALFDFLKYEYFKFEIGAAVRKYAPQTLFVVAAGNDGKWVDGLSRSALPMDISSPFLAAFEDIQKGDVAPNNNLTNILAVGSIDPQGRLSSFTNILLGSKTPYVLAHGESILSPVKTTDIEGVTQLIDSNVPMLLKPELSGDDVLLAPFFESKVSKDVADDDRFSQVLGVKTSYQNATKILKTLGEAIQLHMFLKYPNHRARMSGTSMATPAVTGLMSHLIIEKAKRLGVSPQAIYDLPEFTPSQLVEDMFKTTTPLGGSGGRGIAMSALMNDLKNEPAQGAVDLEKTLKDAVERGKNNKCLLSKGATADPFCD